MYSAKRTWIAGAVQVGAIAARGVDRGRSLAGLMLLLALTLTLPAKDAYAQLRGLGGGVGGVGGVGGAVGGISGGVPGLSGIGGGFPGDIIPQSGTPDRIGSGISIPIENGSAPSLPPLTTPNPLNNTVTNTLGGTVPNALAVPGQVTNRLGNTVNQAARNAAAAPARRSGVPPVGERRFMPSEVVVGLPSNLTPQALDALLRRHGLTGLGTQTVRLTATTFHRLRIGNGRSVSDVIRALEADTGVRSAQPNYRFTLAQQDAGAAGGSESVQYAIPMLKLPQAHRLATGENVLVAVIDSGIDTSHPEIAGNIADSFDAVGSKDGPHAHGTAMAGVIIAHAKLTGVAPAAHILAVRAFDSSSAGAGAESTTLVLLKAIDWAVAHGARVINMSFAGPTDPEIARALAAARKKGVVLVAAAGNAGPKSPPLFPASDANVIAVTAIGADDKLLAVANRGKHIALAAPGVDILAAAPQGAYQLTSGTSVAAAHVSGLVALLIERKPDLKPDAVRKILLSTATDLGPKGRDDQFGAGLADAHRAILSLTAVAAAPNRPAVSAAAR
jgi:hypothetical protein